MQMCKNTMLYSDACPITLDNQVTTLGSIRAGGRDGDVVGVGVGDGDGIGASAHKRVKRDGPASSAVFYWVTPKNSTAPEILNMLLNAAPY
eukprot:175089-Amorphochlora_amoeboformis.AAC.1